MRDKTDDNLAVYVPLLEKAMTVNGHSTQLICFRNLLECDRGKIYKMAALLLPFSALRPDHLLNILLKDEINSPDVLVNEITNMLIMRLDGLLDSGEFILAADIASSMVHIIEEAFIKGERKSQEYKEGLACINDFMIRLMDEDLSGKTNHVLNHKVKDM